MIDLKDLLQSEGAEMDIVPIMSIDTTNDIDEKEIPSTLPILALRNAVLFPVTMIPIAVGRKKSLKLVKEAYEKHQFIGAVSQLDIRVEEPKEEDLFHIGTVAKVIKLIEMPDGNITAILQGIKRFTLDRIVTSEPYLVGDISIINDTLSSGNKKDLDMVISAIKDSALQIMKLTPSLPKEASFALKNIEGNEFIINYVASSVELDNTNDKLLVLAESDLRKRGMVLLELLNKQVEILKIKEDIQRKVKSEISQQQREYYLNNQLKTIQEELGIDATDQECIDLRNKARNKKWSKEVAEVFEKELHKLEITNPNSPEFNTQLNYLQLFIDLPWNHYTEDNLDLHNAEKVLNEDHFGLDSVKERIIEYLAVIKLKADMKSPIICLYGPPGVGKTSLGKSIARALGREYGRISLGGLHDESEIRGHRKTYIGAMPGRIIQTIKKCKSSNPVIVLDEIDKVGTDHRGDPASALLEVLDPEQNTTFHDNYLDVDYDLSKVLFVTTANNISTIHPALKDRMEMIPISGYLAEEKVEIANKYLIPKQREAHGLNKSDLKFNKGAIETIIDEYTRESGVRGLDKQIAKIARNRAKKRAFGETKLKSISTKEVKEILGLPTNQHDIQKGNESVGVVTGLAWTEMGGEILFVECSLSKGNGALTTTGNLGDVMKESVTIARQYLKANCEKIGVDPKVFQETDFHIHVPEGAIPKDGPSAGITMVSAMASALCNKSVKNAIAMTGEVTLRGKVLPVGGIKEKILAAKRAGVHTIILSKENEKDINDIKDIYIEGLTFKYVNTIEDVLNYIF